MKSDLRTCILSIVVMGGISLLLVYFSAQSHRVGDVDFSLTSHSSCDVSNPTGQQVFLIYTPVSMGSESFIKELCDELLSESQFSQVQLSHVPRSDFKANHLTGEPFTLIFSRDYFLSSILPGYENFYSELIEWPKYSVHWVSHSPINQHMFESKKIGLLDDEKSQSGYMEPLRYLKHLQIDIKRLNVRYFHNRESMLSALFENEVDVIPIASLERGGIDSGSLHLNLINDQLELGSWYLHRSVPAQSAYKITAFLSSYLENFQE